MFGHPKLFLFTLIQRTTLYSSYSFFRLFPVFVGKKYKWSVGTSEVASFLKNISTSLSETISVCLSPNPFYQNFNYDYENCANRFPLARKFLSVFYGPFLLGFLLNKVDGFIFLWSNGFLLANDAREFEFWFIKKTKKKVVCFFLGNDVRSIVKEKELGASLDLDVAANYYKYISPLFSTPGYELEKRKIAEVAEKYSDFIFNADIDQSSYLTKKSLPFLYFFPEEKIQDSFTKFNILTNPLIVHAPSSAIIKGSQLVRAAVKKLKSEGYVFRYLELEGVPNTLVLEKLKEAHIVMNEFYMFTPGVFGIEAMANCCVLLTAADESIEVSLPAGSNLAWISTKYFQIYDNLKGVLDSPNQWERQARLGNKWVRCNASNFASGKRMSDFLNGN
jgi:hypothetical protein